jgi:hypothetical protein
MKYEYTPNLQKQRLGSNNVSRVLNKNYTQTSNCKESSPVHSTLRFALRLALCQQISQGRECSVLLSLRQTDQDVALQILVYSFPNAMERTRTVLRVAGNETRFSDTHATNITATAEPPQAALVLPTTSNSRFRAH